MDCKSIFYIKNLNKNTYYEKAIFNFLYVIHDIAHGKLYHRLRKRQTLSPGWNKAGKSGL